MNRLFFGNFDFEEQLRGETRRPARLERLVTELAACWLAVCDAEDRIWCPEKVDPGFLEALSSWMPGVLESVFVSEASQIPAGMELVPWGWSPAAVEFGRRHGLRVNSPAVDLVTFANSREFSVPREVSPDDETEFAKLFRTLGQVLAQIERMPQSCQWVIKANWSHAARERIIGRGPMIADSEIAWIKQRLARDGVVAWEWWLDRRGELGVQWEISPPGAVHLVAVTELLVDARGQYAGTLVPGPSAASSLSREQDQAVMATRPVVEELAALGYFGPVGIDCVRYYDPITRCERLRPLQDINVRWTMGRLAAEWSRKLGGQPMLWWHGARESAPEWTHPLEWLATAPDLIAGEAVRHSTSLVLLPQ
jgi:hypothetical protein